MRWETNETMEQLLAHTIELISAIEPQTGAKLQEYVQKQDAVFHLRAEHFFLRFKQFLESKGQPFDYGIRCYLKLREAMGQERVSFLRNQRYSNTSFAEVDKHVYGNPDVMQYHMYGLVFGQFLWPDQYHRYSFFCDKFPQYAPHVKSYLEVGGGHALYVSHAASVLPEDAHIDVVDISPSSFELAQGMMPGSRVSWHLIDIHKYTPERRYDFITIGEVLEHLEDPLSMLRRIRELLQPNGAAYITTPANAPMVDHIYLFN